MTQSLKLLEAKTPFMQRSGAQRVRLLASSGLADEQLLKEGAPAKLLAMLYRESDQGVPAIPQNHRGDGLSGHSLSLLVKVCSP